MATQEWTSIHLVCCNVIGCPQQEHSGYFISLSGYKITFTRRQIDNASEEELITGFLSDV